MNKLAIPAILAATVLVAGIFAFSPVEQASTVHLTLASADNTSLMGPITDGTTTLTSTSGGTTTGTYTYTTNEISKVLAIEITADFSGQAVLTDALDVVRAQTLTLDGLNLDDIGPDLPINVVIGTDGAADSINLMLELAFAGSAVEPIRGANVIIVTPNTALVLTVQLVDGNNVDAATPIPVTVTFYTEAAGSAIEDSTLVVT